MITAQITFQLLWQAMSSLRVIDPPLSEKDLQDAANDYVAGLIAQTKKIVGSDGTVPDQMVINILNQSALPLLRHGTPVADALKAAVASVNKMSKDAKALADKG